MGDKTWAERIAERRAAGADCSPDVLLEMARTHRMSFQEIVEQRRSWVIGELMLEHPELTREEALRRVKAAELGLMYGGNTR